MLSHYLYYLEMLPADASHQTMYLIDNHTVKEQKNFGHVLLSTQMVLNVENKCVKFQEMADTWLIRFITLMC